MTISYRIARRDFELLETLRELKDQVDLDSQRLDLMRNPTKAAAAELYCHAVGLWLNEHKNDFATAGNNALVKRMKTRYAGYF